MLSPSAHRRHQFWLHLFLLVVSWGIAGGCQPKPPPSPTAEAFRLEVQSILRQLQQSLAAPTAQRDIAAIDQILATTAGSILSICLDCPYRSGVFDQNGVLLTTFPKTKIAGMNFSAYKHFQETIQKQRVTQSLFYLPDRAKMYFINAPLVQGRRVVGVVVLGMTPADLERKWQLSGAEFLALDLNSP
jgi:C4-dicarboxylate-specific signal transduction histidine kinase